MSLTSTTRHASYTGDGATVAFSFPIKFLADAHLEVYVDGTLKTLTTDYTVSGAGEEAGGTVTFLSAPANSLTVLILRVTPIEQATDWAANAKFNSQQVEDDLDELLMVIIDRTPYVYRGAGSPNGSQAGYADKGGQILRHNEFPALLQG